MKRITSLVLVLALTLAMFLTVQPALAAEAWDGTAATNYAGGSGTRDDPYLISTPGQLALFRDQVNGGRENICAQLSDNVDMGMQSWKPIGLSSSGYNGLFEGNGYAIRNLKIDQFSSGTSSGSGNVLYGGGLFGIIGKNGIVRHVNVDGVVSANKMTEEGLAPDIGAICGGNLGVIEECFSTCSFRDFVLDVRANGWVNIGGIAGCNEGTIRNCYMVGTMDVTVTGSFSTLNVGGLVGKETGSGGTIRNCYSVVTIRANSNEPCNVGGLVGWLLYDGTYENLYTNQELCNVLVGDGGVSWLKNCETLLEKDMKSLYMLDKLGSAFAIDSHKVNDGYPILAVMAYEEEAGENAWYTQEVTQYGLTQAELDKLIPVSLWNKDLTKNVTRVEFAEIAVNLYESLSGQRVEIAIDNPFTDISNEEIVRAYQLGITNGTSATTFNPYSSISRQDMATMLTRVYKKLYIPGWTLGGDSGYKLDYTMPQQFLDHGRIAGYAQDSVYYMASQGIIKGSNGYFYPVAAADGDTVGNATREQAIITSIRYYSVNR